MFISQTHKLVFVHIPKTGGCSIFYQLKELLGEREYPAPKPDIFHMTISDLRGLFPEVSSYFKFTIVRHPLSRFVSTYNYLAKLPERKWWNTYQKRRKDTTDMFAEVDLGDVMWMPQYKFVRGGYDSRDGVDYIGKFEDYSGAIKHVNSEKDLNLDPEVVINKTAKANKLDLPMDNVREFVWAVYKKDFEMFDYRL